MAKGEASGEILNNTGTMEYQKASRQLSVSFRNMQLRKIKRAEKKGTESVMDEKFSLLFQSKFSVGGGELVFQVWTLSLPVVVIVHGNQEPHAWATVTWDNAFAEPGRTPFVVPEKVPWSQVAETLSTKFRSATGRALTESNQRFLASKAFRNPNLQLPLVGPEAGNLMLTWSQFCKEPLYESNFTFWEWFYALMKLTREHLRAPWMDNTIVGFIGRKQTEDLLKQCLRGTFMLRFSDSELGGVTIAWVGDSSEVFMLQPFTSKDFAIRTLADRVSDLKHLIYLYPDIPKDQAFGKYYTPFTDSQTPTNGYVKPLLVTHVPGWSSGGGNLETGSYPPTPQGFYNPQVLPTTEWQLSPRRSDYVLSYVGRNGRAMSYGTIQPYLDSRKHLKLQTGHTVTVIALHGQRIQISCSVINLTSSGSYLEFREKDGDIAKQPVINRVYTSKSNTMAVYSQIVKDADWFNCKWKTTDSYPIHKLCRDIEAKTINGAIQSMDLAEESHRFCTFSIVVPLDQHVQISCSVVSLASGCGLKFHEERGWMNEAGLISTRPIIDRNYTSKGNKMFIQADSFDNKRCRFDCTWKTTTTPTYRLCFYKRAKSLNGTIQPLDDAGMDGPRFCPFTITAARTDQLIRISCSVVKLTTVLSSLRFYDGRDAGANVIAYPPIANKVYTSKGNTLVVFSWKFDDDWFDCEWATVQASS